jgi:LysR family transcriptional regulator, transcriptional activator of the cysJI operon
MVRSSKDFERLDQGLFRAFMAAAETLNFTRAAEKAALTQSGVSQHVARLEDNLGVALFTRSNKSVLLTDAGHQLVRFIEQYMDEADALYERLQNMETQVTGLVSYAMPGSCLFAPHLSQMLKQRKKFPGLSLQIQIRTNSEIIEALLRGQYDFGFLTETVDVPGLKLIPFCEEEFVLVSSQPDLKLSEIEHVLDLDFVKYPGMDVYFDAWQRFYFPKSKKRYYESLKVQGAIDSIHGAVAMATGSVGSIVVPRHCVELELQRDVLFMSLPSPQKRTLQNQIYIGLLADRVPTKRAKMVMDWFLKMYS